MAEPVTRSKPKRIIGSQDVYKRQVFGVTIHYVDATLDGGKIISQRAFGYDGDDIAELEARIHAVEYPLYIEKMCIRDSAQGEPYARHGAAEGQLRLCQRKYRTRQYPRRMERGTMLSWSPWSSSTSFS